jgi:hypothetical protein
MFWEPENQGLDEECLKEKDLEELKRRVKMRFDEKIGMENWIFEHRHLMSLNEIN